MFFYYYSILRNWVSQVEYPAHRYNGT
uniref:Uncharacterized protein n=1 Tax=Anguilla anguilla TaxID=7936 RepID=A0A0E9R2R4_ANGAN